MATNPADSIHPDASAMGAMLVRMVKGEGLPAYGTAEFWEFNECLRRSATSPDKDVIARHLGALSALILSSYMQAAGGQAST